MKELLHASEFDGFPLDLHLSMVQDRPRMEAFRAALRGLVRPGDTVVDVGSGTGILALLAWQAGAGRVIALERSEIIEPARRWIAQRYPQAPIEFLRLDVEREPLPEMQADVLVCELLGNLGPEERIVPVLNKVSAAMLKPGGQVIPGKVELKAVPIQLPKLAQELNAWSAPLAGFDLSVFQELAWQRVYHLQGERFEALAAPATYQQTQWQNTTAQERSSTARFDCTQAGALHGFACWFEADLGGGVQLSSGPEAPLTHWGQVFFPIGPAQEFLPGDTLSFELKREGDEFDVLWGWQGELLRSKGERFAFSLETHGSA